MPKCDFNKVAFGMGVLLHIFRIPFPKNTSGGLLLSIKPSECFKKNKKIEIK